MIISNRLKTDLHIFLGITALLILIGTIFIYSSSSILAYEMYGSSDYFVKKQLLGILLGLVALITSRYFPLKLIKKLSPLCFLSSLFLTALTLVPLFSTKIHGASRWLNIFGFRFQPSEFLKLSLVFYLAYFFSKRSHKAISFFHTYVPFFIILSLVGFVLLKQPDFGLTVTLATTGCVLLFISQFHTYYFLLTILSSIPAIVFLILSQPYRLKRIVTFLNPWADPHGSGFQIIQSLIAIGSGSFWGMGISQSKQKFFYLPMQHTDFIFSIIAEESGFIGSCFLIFLYTLFLYFGIKIAVKLCDTFAMLATTGFVVLISLQTVINIAVVTGLVPTKGIGLPFVSYGNTALVCNIAMIGFIINMVHNNQDTYALK